MAKLNRARGATSNIFVFFLMDSASTVGAGKTGLLFSTASLNISIRRELSAAVTTYVGNVTVQTITTLGTFAAPSASNCRFKEIDSTNQPGMYEIQFLDALFNTGDASRFISGMITATGIAPCPFEIELTAWDNQNAVNGGITALPNTACTTNGSLHTQGTGTAQINTDGAGNVPMSMAQAISAVQTDNTVGEALLMADLFRGRKNTAQGPGTGNNQIQLDAGASSVAGNYVGDGIWLNGGTGGGLPGTGQVRTIVAYNTVTKTCTVDRNWQTLPDATTTYITLPWRKADVCLWNETAVSTPATAGIPDVNVKNIVNVAAALDANNLLKVDVEDIRGTLSAGTAGYVGPDWGHVNAPTSTVGLTGTTISAAQVVASVSGAVGSVTGAVGSVTGAVGSVTAGVTVTTNNDKTGYSLTQAFPTNFAALGISAGGHISNVDTLTTYTGNTLQTGDSFARLGAPAGASIAADLAEIEGETDALLAGVIVTTNNDKVGYALSAAGLDLVVLEAGLNARQGLSIIASASAGVLAGAATTTVLIAAAGVPATNRISATVDASGNRSAVTLSPPA